MFELHILSENEKIISKKFQKQKKKTTGGKENCFCRKNRRLLKEKCFLSEKTDDISYGKMEDYQIIKKSLLRFVQSANCGKGRDGVYSACNCSAKHRQFALPPPFHRRYCNA